MPVKIPAYKGTDPYIFVSYSHKDSEVVMKDIAWMNDNGYRVWYDEGIEFGQDFPEELALAIKNSCQFIVYLSQNSIESKFVNREINFAIFKDLKIFPIYLEKTALSERLEFLLSTLHYLERYKYERSNYCEYFDKGLASDCKYGQTTPSSKGNRNENTHSTESGNTTGNITNGGHVAMKDGWVYYSNGSDDDKLYKVCTDGTGRIKLNDDRSSYINVADDWVYYSNFNDGGKLCKIRIDGTGRQKVE